MQLENTEMQEWKREFEQKGAPKTEVKFLIGLLTHNAIVLSSMQTPQHSGYARLSVSSYPNRID